MALTTGAMLALALAANANGERLLLCRPKIVGDPALARGDAVARAAHQFKDRFLDYGVACDDAAEGARAARRAGLRHAITASAEGRTDGSRFVLALADGEGEVELASRVTEVAPGVDPTPLLHSALDQVLAALPREPARDRHVGAWSLVGAGAAAVVTGVALAVSANAAADRADRATDPGAYTSARDEWKRKRGWSRAAFGLGGAALAAGLTWRFAF